ncbi:MAG TPA: hypothetical protein VGD52_04075 [Pseudoduganella sp.]
MQIREQINARHEDFGIQSMDASSDGKRAVILGYGQDPDFPEIFIYSAETGKARKFRTEGHLIDLPASQAFWAENERDIYISRYDCSDVYLLTRDTRANKVVAAARIEEITEYIRNKLVSVRDAFYGGFKEKPKPPAVPDDPYHRFVLDFVENFGHILETHYNWALLKGFVPGEKQAYAKEKLAVLCETYELLITCRDTSGAKIDLDKVEATFNSLQRLANGDPR